MERSHAFYAWATTAIIAVCATIIVVTGHAVPEALWIVGAATGGGAAGVSVATVRPARRVRE